MRLDQQRLCEPSATAAFTAALRAAGNCCLLAVAFLVPSLALGQSPSSRHPWRSRPTGAIFRLIGETRIKANLYTNQGEIITHPAHHEVPPDAPVFDKMAIAVYHVNACNGNTVVGDRQIPWRENQLIVFNNVSYYGTMQTDTDTRVVINFNLITRE